MSLQELLQFLNKEYADKIIILKQNIETKTFYHCSKEIKTLLPFQWFIDILPMYVRFNHFLDEKIKRDLNRKQPKYLFIKPWEDIELLLSRKIIKNFTPIEITLQEGKVKNYYCIKDPQKRYFVKILKTYKDPSDITYPLNISTLQEIFINVNLNLIKDICPFFVKTFYVTISDKVLTDIDPKFKERYWFIIMEHLIGDNFADVYLKIGTQTMTDELKKEVDDLLQYSIIQLLYAIYCSYNWFGFIHNDLTNIRNIKIVKLNPPRDIILKFDEENIFVLKKCPFLIKIFDFGLSYVKPPNMDNFTFQSEDIESIMVKIFGMFKIPGFTHKGTSAYLNSFKNNDIGGFLIVIFKLFNEYIENKKLIAFFFSYFDIFENITFNKKHIISIILKCLNFEIFNDHLIRKLPELPKKFDKKNTFIYKKLKDEEELWREVCFHELYTSCE